jgi:pimeloyl-ACP methyl ester carboxylesterase
LRVETFVWSCGTGRIVVDHMDHCNHLEQGRRLAGLVAADRQAYPDRAVSLLAHSTGCAVALAAAECLPPDSVERIVLLAPSVSADYDLRPALRAARQGIDVFVSRRDIGALGIGMGIVGTADRRWGPVAGRVGFAPVVTSPADEALYTRLHVHPWEPCLEWTGNHGGHFGTTRLEYVRAYLLPLFLRKPCPPPIQ